VSIELKKHPGLTIITPSFNQTQFIETTIQSVLSQETDFPVEYIVMDGGSADGTLDILRKYEDRLQWTSEKDNGQSDAINKGIKMATGDVVAWINSDDFYLPGTLQAVMDGFRAEPGSEWLYGRCRIINTHGVEIRKWIRHYKNMLSARFSYNRLLTENFITQPSAFFRKDAFLQAGALDEGLSYTMDYDLWLKLGKKSKPIVINKDLACFRIHGESKGTLHFRKQFEEEYMVHKRHDQRRRLLFLHRINVYKIVFAYKVLAAIKAVSSGG
jgi:glycosyltransferase involved in cell wall biosynthesis